MKKLVFFVFPWMILPNLNGQVLYDSFADGDFSVSPVWTGNNSAWAITVNSDVSTGAIGSNTLRLNAPAIAQTDYLSSQILNWGISQEWGFFMGRRSQAYTSSNQAYFWLYANENNLTSATVDGYRIAIGDDSGSDEIRLEYILNGTVNSIVISSGGAITNGLTDIGILVRVTRSSTGVWTIFTSTMPVSSGTGAIASGIPDSINAAVNQATATNNLLAPAASGFIGVAALHSTGASAITTAEFDQIYFTQSASGSTLPVCISIFSGRREGQRNQLQWSTVFEQNNAGFQVQRSSDGFNYISLGFVSTLAFNGNSTGELDYSFTDHDPGRGPQYYRLRQEDIDGKINFSYILLIGAEKDPGLSIVRPFPNPARDNLNVVIAAPSKDKVEVFVTDLSGKKVWEGTINVYKGMNTIPINLGPLSDGTYILRLNFGNNRGELTCKFVKTN